MQENTYTAHAYARADDHLAAVIITDQEYPVRVAFSLLNKILDDFTARIPASKWKPAADAARSASTGKADVGFTQIQEYIVKYQDPKQADTIMRVQQELDETKIVLVRFPST